MVHLCATVRYKKNMTFLEPARLFCLHTPIATKKRLLGDWFASLPHPVVMVQESLAYFTVWSLGTTFLALVYAPSLLPVAKIMALQSSLGGGYIAIVHPRMLRIPYCRIQLTGILLCLLDIYSHHIPFVYLVSLSPSCPPFSILHQAPFLLYLLCFSVTERYGLRWIDIARLFLLYAVALYLWYSNFS